jgi:hypothetical protein
MSSLEECLAIKAGKFHGSRWHERGRPAYASTRFKTPGGPMSEELVVLWRDCEAGRELCYEIVQLAEDEFELRVICDGRLFISEDAADIDDLIAKARQLRADLHPAT